MLRYNECENTKMTADFTPTVEEIREKMEKHLETELKKSFVENDVKSKNATVPSEEIIQESFLAKVNQIEPSENERHDHMKAHSVKNAGVDNTDTELTDTSKQSAENTLVWEIKSKNSKPPVKDVPGNRECLAQDSLMTEASQDTVVDKQYSKNALEQIEKSASVAHVEVASEEQTECPPAKRATVEPIWATNVIDNDQPNVSQQNMEESESDDLMKENEQYILSGTRYEELEKWLQCKTYSSDRAKLLELVEKSKLNKGVLKLTHLSKTIGLDELYELLVNRLQHIDEEIVKKIAHIHLARSDESMITAYVKWREEDMLLAVKAYHLLENNRLPLVSFDDRSVIDWDHSDRPIIVSQIVTSDGQVVPPYIYNDYNVNATFSGPRLPPPEPFTTGDVDPFDPFTFGLSKPFMSYFKCLQGPKLPVAVIASNLSKERSLDSLLNMFSAAGHIKAYSLDKCASNDTVSLQIEYDHPLESVQAISMFHHQELDGRIMYLNRTCKLNKWCRKRGFKKFGTGLGPGRSVLRNARHSMELYKLRLTTAMEIKQLKMEMCELHGKLVAAMNKQKENQKLNSELENERNASKTQQDNVNILTTVITSSLQSKLMGLLGNKLNQQNILSENLIIPEAVKSSAPTNESRTQTGKIYTDSEKEAVSVIQNIPLPDMQTANHSALNMQQKAHGFINPQDQYASAYSAYMQGIQYGYPMATNTNQPGNSNTQPATSSMQPATLNVQSKPTNQTSNKSKVPLTTAREPLKPATRFDIPLSPIQSQRPSAANLPIASKKPANRIDEATNVLSQRVEPATKSLEIPPTHTQALVKTAFKNVNPIQPIAAQAKPANIKFNIPSLHHAKSAKKRTLNKNEMEKGMSDLPTKLPVYELQKEEAWITKQIKAMRRNSKSPDMIGNSEIMGTTPERKGIYPDTFGPPAKNIRKSPESTRSSPEIITKVKQKSPKRFRRSPERSRKSPESFRKSAIRSKKSPERFIESPERSRKSRDKLRKSPKTYRKSPEKFRNSPERFIKSPKRSRNSPKTFRKSPDRFSESPETSRKSPERFRKLLNKFIDSSVRYSKSPESSRKSPDRFRKSPVRYSKSPERTRKSPTQTQALVKTAFKNFIPIQPIAAQAKPANIKINIPSLHPAKSAKKRTLNKNEMEKGMSDLPTKLSVYELKKEEAWITKQIKAMRRNSKSPDKIGNCEIMGTTPDRKGIYPDTFGPPAKKIRKSPESIRRSPEIITKVKQKSPKRFKRSPERSRKSPESFRKSPIRSKKSPERFIESPERSRKSRDKIRKSPETYRKSPQKFRNSLERFVKSPKRSSNSPKTFRKSPDRFSKSPERSRKSPDRFIKSPVRYSKSPVRTIKSPDRFIKSPVRYSKSPERSIPESPERFRKSPKNLRKSPVRYSKSPERYRKSPDRFRKSVRYSISSERSRKSIERIRKSDRFSKSPERFRNSPKRSRRSASDDSWDIEPPRSPSINRKSPFIAAYEEPKGVITAQKRYLDRSRERDTSICKDRDRSKASFSKEREPERDNVLITKVYFTCLPASVTTADLQEQMSEIGPVSFAHAYGDSGQGVVEFRHRRDAETCIQMYDLAKVDGKTIEARWFK